MNFLFGSLLTYLGIAFLGVFILIILLLLWIVLRQRGTRKRIVAMEHILDMSIEDASEQRRVDANRQLASIVEALKMLDPLEDRFAAMEKGLNEFEKRLVENFRSVEESVTEVGFSSSTMENLEADMANVRQRFEGLEKEFAKSYQWLDDFRILERVVLHLIGPEKLRALIAKERRESTPPQALPAQKRSIL